MEGTWEICCPILSPYDVSKAFLAFKGTLKPWLSKLGRKMRSPGPKSSVAILSGPQLVRNHWQNSLNRWALMILFWTVRVFTLLKQSCFCGVSHHRNRLNWLADLSHNNQLRNMLKPWSYSQPNNQITLWLFNIAMENDPFIDDFPIKTCMYFWDFPWLS